MSIETKENAPPPLAPEMAELSCEMLSDAELDALCDVVMATLSEPKSQPLAGPASLI